MKTLFRKIFGMVPPFAWPIFASALIWLLLSRRGWDTRAADGILFVATLIACILIGVLGSRRETLNDKAGRK